MLAKHPDKVAAQRSAKRFVGCKRLAQTGVRYKGTAEDITACFDVRYEPAQAREQSQAEQLAHAAPVLICLHGQFYWRCCARCRRDKQSASYYAGKYALVIETLEKAFAASQR